MKNIATFALLVLSASLGAEGKLSAQHYHGHTHGHVHGHTTYRPYYVQPQHGHDQAGHMVDSQGHHVAANGAHTGSLGLLDGNVVGNALPTYVTNYGGQPMVAPMPALPIKITNPASSSAAIGYALNGMQYTIRPGESQTLYNDRAWVIQFDRGGEFGAARYTLTPGNYEFAPSANGWDVFQQSPSVRGAQPMTAGLPTNPAPNTPQSGTTTASFAAPSLSPSGPTPGILSAPSVSSAPNYPPSR